MYAYKRVYRLDAQVTAVAARGDHVLDFAKKHQIHRSRHDLPSLLADTEIDVIDICTPPALHASMIVAAVQAGKHVICEKPFTGYFGRSDDKVPIGKHVPKSRMYERVMEEMDKTCPLANCSVAWATHPIGPIFVDDRDLDVLRLATELGLGIFREKRGACLAILIGVNLGAKHVLAILILEHGSCDRRGDPQNLLLCLDLGGERYGVRAGIDAEHDFNLLLVDQPLYLVDRSIGLALRIRIDRLHLIFALDPATLVDDVDRDLRTDRTGDRAPAAAKGPERS